MSDPLRRLPFRETRAYVDLDALHYNIQLIRDRFPGQGLAPAVKADAYGHGAAAIAGAGEQAGVTMMSVANLEEYLYLRDHGVRIPIIILEDLFEGEIEVALRAGARLNVSSVEYARAVSALAVHLREEAFLHVNIDTGMGRMGLFSDDPAKELGEISSLPNIEIEGIFSHFSCSDEGDIEFSALQIGRYRDALDAAERIGVAPRYRHIANSGAILDFPEDLPFDLVRPGLAMYGMYPSDAVRRDLPLRPVLSLVSRLVKVTRYDRRWSIGYGKTYWTRPGSVIGVIPIGYGDGYPRLLSNRSRVLVGGEFAPVVGRVSMDMITVDLTDIRPIPHVGDSVVIIGSGRNPAGTTRTIGAEDLARECSTIPYEITCNLSTRVPRLYLREGHLVASQTFREGYRVHASEAVR